jgi:hypothetical protein
MTTGLRLTLLCLVMLCRLLSLTQPAEFDHLLPIVGSGSWFAPHTESATDAPPFRLPEAYYRGTL